MELVGRIFAAIQRFSPSPQWNFDSIIQILKESGGYIRNDIISSVCEVVGRSEVMQTYALSKIGPLLTDSATVQPLVQVACWILGEFGTGTDETQEILSQILKLPQTTLETKGYILTAQAKLAARAGQISQLAIDAFVAESRSNDLDLQQRSGEFIQILTQTAQAESVLAPAPPVQGADDAERQAAGPKVAVDLDNWIVSAPPPPSPAPTADLLDLLGDAVQAPTPPPAPAPAPAPIPTSGPVPTPATVAPPLGALAYDSGDLQVYFEVQKRPNNPNMLAIRASSYNRGSLPISGYLLEYATPDGWVGQKQPPNASEISPGGAPIQQVTFWRNNGVQTQAGMQFRPMMMSIRVTYKYGSMPTRETQSVPPSVFK
jgi:AP-1 complex subunit gamma-1